MNILQFQEFDKIYLENLNNILLFCSKEMQTFISLHCSPWRPEKFNFSNYLDHSSKRYYLAYSNIADKGDVTSLCDIGGLFGVFAITMGQLGYEVTMTESLKLYSNAFEGLFDYIKNQNVEIINYEPFENSTQINKRFDAVTAMAIIEHYPHSLKILFNNIIQILNQSGLLFLECPNILYWQKRWGMLRGRTPLVFANDIYNSKVPFTGHHHEMTMTELIMLAELNDLKIYNQFFFNYSIGRHKLPLRYYLRRSRWILTIQAILTSLWPNMSECIAISCRKNHELS